MPWDESHKMHSHEKILHAAARLFTHHGFNGVSIDTVMQEAGMTRGAFYAHFESKSDLYTQALKHAATQAAQRLALEHLPEQGIERYLSEEHLFGQQVPCPLACLISDVAQQDLPIRSTYTLLFKGFVDRVSQMTPADQLTRHQIIQQVVTMVGGLAIARTLNDESLSKEILEACRELASSKHL
ncbi:TetR/AcrR family transcriptional regulator [Vreelandella alkaliphila]|uniref:TetR/AcrR family transcriptional regulator n=2 Tax=Vreelandella alkaliphila TaxID=272774 RepID=UPI003FD8C013